MISFSNISYLDKNFIPNREQYLFRDTEKEQLDILFDSLNTLPSHIMIYGFAGSGKTSMLKMMINDFVFQTNQKALVINLNDSPTELQAVSYINSKLGINTRSRYLSQHYMDLRKFIDDFNLKLIIVLDEVDKLLYKSGDSLLYNLLETNNISLILITNNVMCFDLIEERVKSRMGGLRKILFKPYNASEIRTILFERATGAFEKEINSGILSKISAISAQEHGDVRKAINLLKSCGEIAHKRKTDINEEYIDIALNMTESNEVKDIINSFPSQAKAVLCSLIEIMKREQKIEVESSELYEEYLKIAPQMTTRILTDRSIADYIWDMDNSGITQSRIVSHGRYGRTRKIKLGVPLKVVNDIVNR